MDRNLAREDTYHPVRESRLRRLRKKPDVTSEQYRQSLSKSVEARESKNNKRTAQDTEDPETKEKHAPKKSRASFSVVSPILSPRTMPPPTIQTSSSELNERLRFSPDPPAEFTENYEHVNASKVPFQPSRPMLSTWSTNPALQPPTTQTPSATTQPMLKTKLSSRPPTKLTQNREPVNTSPAPSQPRHQTTSTSSENPPPRRPDAKISQTKTQILRAKQEMKQEIREELKRDLRQELKQELKKELLQELKQELDSTSSE